MQKAIFYVSKPIAARGMLELTDQRLYFQVQSFESSLGIKSFSLDVCMITDVKIECGDLHPKVIVESNGKRYEFMLSKGKELYDRLKNLQSNPLGQANSCLGASETVCACGKSVDGTYRYCPWCGAKLLVS